jgi:hypothetical protein
MDVFFILFCYFAIGALFGLCKHADLSKCHHYYKSSLNVSGVEIDRVFFVEALVNQILWPLYLYQILTEKNKDPWPFPYNVTQDVLRKHLHELNGINKTFRQILGHI